MECSLLMGGQAGQGLMSIENLFTDLLFRLGYHFFATKFYMSRIRGGHNEHMFRVAENPVHALSGEAWDVVVGLDEETETLHPPGLRDNSISISFRQIHELENTAKENFHDVKKSNELLVGLLLKILGVTPDALESLILEEETRTPLKAGMDFAERWGAAGRFPLKPQSGTLYKFDGNSSIGFGALLGGCRFISGYPMTPATSLQMYLSQVAREMPVHFEQAEDEISAINMALGASYAGLRSMVATSGGGFALMSEGVSLAGMTETPVVIVVAQRPGPSTGLPTRTEQGDLNFVLHAGHGEFPRLIYAPGALEEAIELARRSFEMADRYQIPVFILTDQYLADSIQLVKNRPDLTPSTRSYEIQDASYRRYALTPDGLSPLTYPGLSEALVQLDSDEHTEDGKITEDLDLRVKMVDKRLKKGRLLEQEAVLPTLFGQPTAETFLINWGSNRQIVEEAANRLQSDGQSVAALHFSQVFPLTPDMLKDIPLTGKRLIVIENNATGQFAKLLKRELSISADDFISKYNGLCFTVKELCDEIMKRLSPSGGEL